MDIISGVVFMVTIMLYMVFFERQFFSRKQSEGVLTWVGECLSEVLVRF